MKRRFTQRLRDCPISRAQFDDLVRAVAEASLDGRLQGLDATRAFLMQGELALEPTLDFLAQNGVSEDLDLAIQTDAFSLFGPTRDRLRRMPLARSALESCLNHVDSMVRRGGCDHRPTHLRSWLAKSGHPVAETITAFAMLGGHCDCEAVLNTDPDEIYPRVQPRSARRSSVRPRRSSGAEVSLADHRIDLSAPSKPWSVVQPTAKGIVWCLRLGKRSGAATEPHRYENRLSLFNDGVSRLPLDELAALHLGDRTNSPRTLSGETTIGGHAATTLHVTGQHQVQPFALYFRIETPQGTAAFGYRAGKSGVVSRDAMRAIDELVAGLTLRTA